jgi:CheY-like chemotaxis protein
MGGVAEGAALRVVVVDNDAAALELVVTDLTLEGHDVVGTCLDGVTALDLCRELQPDVAVIDHRMPPGPHGLEVAQRLATLAPDVRVIVFTNYQDPELVAQIRASGATYLPKGNLRALRRAVEAGPTPR